MSTTVWENLFQMLHKMFYNSRTIYYVDQRLSRAIYYYPKAIYNIGSSNTQQQQTISKLKRHKNTKKSFFFNFHSVFQFEDFINVNVKQSETMRIFQIFIWKKNEAKKKNLLRRRDVKRLYFIDLIDWVSASIRRENVEQTIWFYCNVGVQGIIIMCYKDFNQMDLQ